MTELRDRYRCDCPDPGLGEAIWCWSNTDERGGKPARLHPVEHRCECPCHWPETMSEESFERSKAIVLERYAQAFKRMTERDGEDE